MLESLLEFLIQGLVLGGLYALFAVGLSLIFGVLDVINVAHGEFFAIGGYLAFAAVVLLHLPGAVGVLGAAVGTFLLGLCVYPLLIAPLKRRLGGRPQGPLYLVLTLGLSTFLQSSLLAIAGGDYLRVPPQVSGILDLGVTAVSHQRLLVLAAAAVLLSALFAFLRFHPVGLAVRAVALNPDAAQAKSGQTVFAHPGDVVHEGGLWRRHHNIPDMRFSRAAMRSVRLVAGRRRRWRSASSALPA